MAEQQKHFYEFGRFRLSAGQRLLLRDGEIVPLTPKVIEILLALVENAGRLVEKDELMKRVWPEAFVEEGNLTQNISLLRKALGESSRGAQFIETVARRGYRFIAPVVEYAEENAPAVASGSTDQSPIKGRYDSSFEPRVSESLISKAVDAIDNSSPAINSKPEPAGPSGSLPLSGLTARLRLPVLAAAALLIAAAGVVYFAGWGKAGDGNGGLIESIAVLPFANDTADPDTEYLNDKITETLINSLSKLPKLRVAPRSVVLRYKDSDPRKAGHELNVRAVVTGRVHRRGDTVSIQADLIDVANVSQIWGQHYDRRLADILLVQEDISRDIFENLRLKLSVEEKKQLEAYRLYLKGRNSWNKRTEEGLEQGIGYFQEAINTDPNYAPAYAGLADCYNMLVVYGVHRPKDAFPKAKDAAIKALEIDETLAEAHTSLAFIKFRWDWNRVAAEQEFQQAIKHRASYAPAHQWYSSHLVALERFDEAIAEAKRTQELEPLSLIASSHLGWILYLSGQNDRAIEECKRILEVDPNFFPARRYLGLAYEEKGMYKEAIAEFEKAVKLSGSPLILALLGHSYAVSGRKADARNVLNELEHLSSQRYVSPYTLAAIYTGLGDREQAFKWLERAYEERDIWLMNLKVDPVFGRLRSDVRFSDLLRRTSLTP